MQQQETEVSTTKDRASANENAKISERSVRLSSCIPFLLSGYIPLHVEKHTWTYLPTDRGTSLALRIHDAYSVTDVEVLVSCAECRKEQREVISLAQTPRLDIVSGV